MTTESTASSNGIDGLIVQENSVLRDRVTDLEKKVAIQTDDIACLKSAMADCLRRLQSLDSGKANTNSGTLRSQLYSKNEDAAGGHNSYGSPTSPLMRDTNHTSSGRYNSIQRRSATLPLRSRASSHEVPRRAGTLSSPLRIHPPSPLAGHTSQPHSPGNRYSGHGRLSPPNSARLFSMSPQRCQSLISLVGTKPTPDFLERLKEPLFIKDEGILRMFLRGRPINVYSPSDVSPDYDVTSHGEPPPEKLKLEWVYGYRGRDGRSNVHFLPTGEVVYFVAAVVVLYNIEEQTQRHYLEHTDDVKALAIHPDRITIATGQVAGHDRQQATKPLSTRTRHRFDVDKPLPSWPHIRIWNSVNLTTLHVLGLGEFERAVTCIAFSKADGGDHLCAVDEANERVISLWEWRKSHKITETKCSTEPVLTVEFHPMETTSIITCGKGHLAFWSLQGIHLSKKMGLFEAAEKPKFVLCTAFADNGDLITGDSSGNIFIWQRGTNKISNGILNAHEGGIFSLCLTKSGTLLSGGGKDRRLQLWNTNDYTPTDESVLLPEQYGPVRTLTQGPGDMMLVGTTKNCILQGNLDLNFSPIVQGHVDEVWGLACHPSLPEFLTASCDSRVYLCDSLSRSVVWSGDLPEPAYSACFHPSGSGMLAVGARSGKWLLLDCTRREVLGTHTDGQDVIQCLQYSPDGNFLALGSRDNMIYVYSAMDAGARYARIGRCSGHSSSVLHLDWSADSQYLRSTSSDYELLFWAPANCRQVVATSQLRDVEWATQTCVLGWSVAGIWQEGADGTDINACAKANWKSILATADDFGKVNLYTYPACQPRGRHHTYTGHSSHVTNVTFLQDDSRLISTGGGDTAVMQWEVICP